MPKETPATEDVKQMRLDEIKGLIVKAMHQRDIVKYCLEKHPEWNVSDRQIRNYVYDAQAQLRQDATEIDFAAELAKAKARNELGMMLALKISDIKTFGILNKQNQELLNLKNLRYEPEWKETARAAGLDPDELLKGFFASEQDVIVGDELNDHAEQ